MLTKTFRFLKYIALTTLLLFSTACGAVIFDNNLANPPIAGNNGSQAPVAPDKPISQALSYPAEYSIPFATTGDYIGTWNGSGYTPFFAKGVNLGVGIPGTAAGELAITREQYAKWFIRMGEIGVNSLRIYTLHFPRFYEELAKYNASHPDKPIYLFHGAWLDDNPTFDLYNMTESFDSNIREVIDAVHGKADIEHRFGEAYGTYRTNISRWVMAWVIAREIDPHEMTITNSNHKDQISYQGENLRLPGGNPAEVWLAQRVDGLISYERKTYQEERPVSVSSWPTLDPLIHPTENEKETSEDVASYNLAQLDLFNAPAGYFASFHAYPYYPDFIVDDPGYKQFNDRDGINNYLGYLHDLKQHYKNIPLFIGEYGVPTSWGNAHYSPSGMHHGGHDEEAQGKYDARQLRNIYESKAGGGFLFAWFDEWWKRTWIVDERSMPRSRYQLWHNITSPEENFGLITFDVIPPPYQSMSETSQHVQKIEVVADAAYFHTRVHLSPGLKPNDKLTIGYNTYRDDLGESILPNGVKTSNRNEFALTIDYPSKAQLYVTQAYDLFRIWHGLSAPEQKYQSTITDGAPWNPVRWQNGQVHHSKDGTVEFPETIFPIGELRMRPASGAASSLDSVVVYDDMVDIRIPWTLLQFTDPSTLSVIHDDRGTPGRETTTSEGIALSVSIDRDLIETSRYRWQPWESPPENQEREKPSMEIFAKTLKDISERP